MIYLSTASITPTEKNHRKTYSQAKKKKVIYLSAASITPT